MPICIECSFPVPQLYHVLHSSSSTKKPCPPVPPKPANISSRKNNSKTASSATAPHSVPQETKAGAGIGSDVRLTQCPRCKRFADKYVEHDFVVLFIDLVLIKPQVYRHLLFNRLSPSSASLDPSIIRLGALLLLFDVYITWSHIESLPVHLMTSSRVIHLPVLLQYCFFLFLCLSTTLSQHLTVRFLAGWMGLNSEDEGRLRTGSDRREDNSESSNGLQGGQAWEGSDKGCVPTPKRPTANAISTALFVSSCMSLFPILMVVWKFGDASASPPTLSPAIGNATNSTDTGLTSVGKGVDWVRKGVSWIVAVQNFEALRILLDCGYLYAGLLVMAGGIVRWLVRTLILGAAGLGEAG